MGNDQLGVELFEGNMASMQKGDHDHLCKEMNRRPWQQVRTNSR